MTIFSLVAGGVFAAIQPQSKSKPGSTKKRGAKELVATVDSTRVILRIGQIRVANRAVHDTIPVTMESFGTPVAAFDLKIGSDNPDIAIIGVLPGDICDSCAWSFFHARQVAVTGSPEYPKSMWQIVGLAQGMSDTSKPKCYGFDGEGSLVKLVVSNEHVIHRRDTTAALFFVWERCSDNALSGLGGAELYLSSRVLDYFPVHLEEPRDAFPTRHGAPRQCVNPGAKNKPKRVVEMTNGGVQFRWKVDSLKTPSGMPGVPPGTPFSPDSAGNSSH